MENKDINKAAREYAGCSICKGCDTEESIKCGSYDGFLAGVQYYQSDIEKYQLELESAQKREIIRNKIIEEKRNEIAELRAQKTTRWIPVSEKLPEYGERVLTLCEDTGSYCVNYLDASGLWRDASCAEHRGVTHWQYIATIKYNFT